MMLRTLRLGVGLLAAALAVPALSATPASTEIDPKQLAKAEVTALAMLPAGSVGKIMGPMFDQMGKQMSASMFAIPMETIARIGGLEPGQAAQLGEATLQELMAIIDPAFDQRIAAMMSAMGRHMGPMMAEFEPDMRAAMARTFALKYSAAELDEINRFLSTPTGVRFGAGFTALAADPEYLKAMEGVTQRLMQAMPVMMERIMAETKAIPRIRNYDDLTEAEKRRIAALLGMRN